MRPSGSSGIIAAGDVSTMARYLASVSLAAPRRRVGDVDITPWRHDPAVVVAHHAALSRIHRQVPSWPNRYSTSKGTPSCCAKRPPRQAPRSPGSGVDPELGRALHSSGRRHLLDLRTYVHVVRVRLRHRCSYCLDSRPSALAPLGLSNCSSVALPLRSTALLAELRSRDRPP